MTAKRDELKFTTEEFEQLVVEALDGLPEELKKALHNIEVVVAIWPTIADTAFS